MLFNYFFKSNPGSTKYPCGECNKPVGYGGSIAYDNCNKWCHKSCIKMHTIVYDCYTENSKLEWECCNCAIKNISFFLFNHLVYSDHFISSPICSSSPNITTKKAKKLRNMTINFQSIWGKKVRIRTCPCLKQYRCCYWMRDTSWPMYS